MGERVFEWKWALIQDLCSALAPSRLLLGQETFRPMPLARLVDDARWARGMADELPIGPATPVLACDTGYRAPTAQLLTQRRRAVEAANRGWGTRSWESWQRFLIGTGPELTGSVRWPIG